jgi:hypothetical protein
MRARERGIAIVLAISVVAMAAMVAAAIMVSQSTWARRLELTAEHVQARSVLQAGADWARAVLSDDRRQSNVDHLGEPWALRLPPMPVENGELVGKIEDQQGLFNVNNLVAEGKVNFAQLAHFRRRLASLSLPDALAYTLVDWIDDDSLPQPQGGAEDAYYLGLDPPYLAANRPLIDVDEELLDPVGDGDPLEIAGGAIRIHPRQREYGAGGSYFGDDRRPGSWQRPGNGCTARSCLFSRHQRLHHSASARTRGRRHRLQREQRLFPRQPARDHRRRASARQGAAFAHRHRHRVANYHLAQIPVTLLT